MSTVDISAAESYWEIVNSLMQSTRSPGWCQLSPEPVNMTPRVGVDLTSTDKSRLKQIKELD